MAVVSLVDFFQTLDSWGFTDILLPFLLVFAVVFAILEKIQIFGGDKKNINAIVALVLGVSFVMAHVTGSYPIGYDPVEILNAALPSISLLTLAIIMMLILIGVFAHDKIFLGLTAPGWIAFFAFLAILYIFGGAAGWWHGGVSNFFVELFGEDIVSIGVMLLVFGLIIAFITGDDKSSSMGDTWEKLGFHFGNLFKK
jgi:hypothetical protein